MKKTNTTPALEKVKRGKGEKEITPFSPLPLFSLSLALGAMLAVLLPAARAEIPEPDNVVFGTIYRDGLLVTAADYDVNVQVRRTPTGPALAEYQMGSNPRFGNFYSVRVKLESFIPTLDSDASQTNDLLYVVVTDYNGDRATTNIVVGQRGTFHQVNFGASSGPDGDGDGLPDAWESLYFGTLGRTGSYIGANGLTALQNYILGTDPNNPDSAFELSITGTNNQPWVSFFALRAQGPGYEGKSRFYSLELSTNPAGPFTGLASYTNILGNNQTVLYPSSTSSNLFFRGRVSLQSP